MRTGLILALSISIAIACIKTPSRKHRHKKQISQRKCETDEQCLEGETCNGEQECVELRLQLSDIDCGDSFCVKDEVCLTLDERDASSATCVPKVECRATGECGDQGQICYDGLCVNGSVCKRDEPEGEGRFLCLHPNKCHENTCLKIGNVDDYIDEDDDENKEFAFRGGGLAPVVEQEPSHDTKKSEEDAGSIEEPDTNEEEEDEIRDDDNENKREDEDDEDVVDVIDNIDDDGNEGGDDNEFEETDDDEEGEYYDLPYPGVYYDDEPDIPPEQNLISSNRNLQHYPAPLPDNSLLGVLSGAGNGHPYIPPPPLYPPEQLPYLTAQDFGGAYDDRNIYEG